MYMHTLSIGWEVRVNKRMLSRFWGGDFSFGVGKIRNNALLQMENNVNPITKTPCKGVPIYIKSEH
jgi:hypothetical protein